MKLPNRYEPSYNLENLSYKKCNFDNSLADSPIGVALWTFLKSDNMVSMLIAAAELKQPSNAAIGHILLKEYKKHQSDIESDQVKQMCGRMIKQIMIHCGYMEEPNDAAIKDNPLFTRGAVFSRP